MRNLASGEMKDLPPSLVLKRLLRTASSERFSIAIEPGDDDAILDLHYLTNGKVSGTLFILNPAAFPEAVIPQLLKRLDDDLLPEVSIETSDLSFTVVSGTVIGTFVAEAVS